MEIALIALVVVMLAGLAGFFGVLQVVKYIVHLTGDTVGLRDLAEVIKAACGMFRFH